MNSNGNIRKVTGAAKVAALEARLDDCFVPDDYLAVIRALVATRHPAAIRVLASLLDSVGPIAERSIKWRGPVANETKEEEGAA